MNLYQYYDADNELMGSEQQDLLPERVLNYAKYLKRSGLPIELTDQQRASLATDANLATYFAIMTRKRFPEAEPQILKNPISAFVYARDVILGPWPAAERIIAQDLWAIESYIYDVLKRPWPAVEVQIAQDPVVLRTYLQHFPERARALAKHRSSAV